MSLGFNIRSSLVRLAGAVLALGASAALAQAPGERSAVIAKDCDYDCLVGFVRG